MSVYDLYNLTKFKDGCLIKKTISVGDSITSNIILYRVTSFYRSITFLSEALYSFVNLLCRLLDNVEGSHGSDKQSCLASAAGWDGESSWWGSQAMIRKTCSYTTLGNVVGEWSVPCKQNTSFVDVKKE